MTTLALTTASFCGLLLPALAHYGTTQREENRARAICQGLLRTDRYAPGFVRVAFHDCVGGCNGCLDLLNPNNAGMESYIESLNEAWDKRRVKEYMSRADFWALCATEAILKTFADAQRESEELREKQTIEQENRNISRMRNRRRQWAGYDEEEEAGYSDTRSPPPELPMVFGRVDCHPTIANQSSGNIFPRSEDGLGETLTFFWKNFRFNAREAAAIMGAHTLGDAKAKTSGFEGTFTEHEQWLDNEYYVDMVRRAKDWRQINARQRDAGMTPRWQWVRPAKNGKLDFLLLNSDICLVRDIRPDTMGRVIFPNEPPRLSRTYPIVKEFADSNALWVKEFAQVFTKMIQNVPRGVVLARPRL